VDNVYQIGFGDVFGGFSVLLASMELIRSEEDDKKKRREWSL
jgi:hypothetical protein